MHNTFNSVKLVAKDGGDLDRLSYSNGDVVYDVTNNTLRLMNSVALGGTKMATQPWTNTAITTALVPYVTTTALSSALTTALSSYATTTSVTTGLATKLSTSTFTSTIANYATTSSVTTALSSYTTTTALTTLLSNKANSNAQITVNGTAITIGSSGTVTANAGTLTGTTLKSTVVNSSLTSVGTLNTLEVAGDIIADTNVVISTVPTAKIHATNKKYVDTRALAMSIAMS